MRKLRLGIIFLICSFGLGLFASVLASDGQNPEMTPYNIVLIYTDDQRWDTLCWQGNGLADICSLPADDHPMPFLEGLMTDTVVFSNAFVTNPICCPARSALLSGGYYSHHTNVLSNKAPTGGATQFVDTVTLGTVLQEQGYATALIGKYFNQYAALVDVPAGTGYVPPGWTLFQATFQAFDWYKTKDVRGSTPSDSSGEGTIVVTSNKYVTYHHRDVALEFLNDHSNQPFFLMLSTKAPHYPAVPPPGFESMYADFSYTERGWGEQDLTDKPYYIASRLRTEPDEAHRDMLRSLRGVDVAIADIVDWLQQNGEWDNTVFIFTSDHGYLWGEHGYYGKAVPYEESIRVPFVIRYPGATPRTEAGLVTADLDLSATIQEIAGVTAITGEGLSLVPLIFDPGLTWRDTIYHEGFDPSGRVTPSWATLHTIDAQGDRWKYTEYASGEVELYDLAVDPYELENVAGTPVYSTTESTLAWQLATWDRGLAITSQNLPDPNRFKLPMARVGQPYTYTFEAWGGVGSYIWSVDQWHGICTLDPPPGLSLQADGLLTGTPTASGIWGMCMMVNDSSTSPQPGNDRPQQHQMRFLLKIKP